MFEMQEGETEMAKLRLFCRDDGPIGGVVAIAKAENGKAWRLFYQERFNFNNKAAARKEFERWAKTRQAREWATENKAQ